MRKILASTLVLMLLLSTFVFMSASAAPTEGISFTYMGVTQINNVDVVQIDVKAYTSGSSYVVNLEVDETIARFARVDTGATVALAGVGFSFLPATINGEGDVTFDDPDNYEMTYGDLDGEKNNSSNGWASTAVGLAFSREANVHSRITIPYVLNVTSELADAYYGFGKNGNKMSLPESGILNLYSIYLRANGDSTKISDVVDALKTKGFNKENSPLKLFENDSLTAAVLYNGEPVSSVITALSFPVEEPKNPGVDNGGKTDPTTDEKTVENGGLGTYITVSGKANNFSGTQGAGAVICKFEGDEYSSDIYAATFKQFFPAKQISGGNAWKAGEDNDTEIANWSQNGAFAVTLAGIEASNYTDGTYWIATYQLVDGTYKLIEGSSVSFNKAVLAGGGN
jgi:hypothetical protein